MSSIFYRVVKLGVFAGGSFGVGSPQDGLVEVWTVRCPRNPLGDNRLPLSDLCAGSKAEADRLAATEAKKDEAKLRGEITRQEKQKCIARQHEDLLRGWDGYQFVGVSEGHRRAAEMLRETEPQKPNTVVI